MYTYASVSLPLTYYVLLLSICVSPNSAESPRFPSDNPHLNDISIRANQSSGCGGVLEAYRGFISYKLNENYDNNERCIWTIKSTRAVILFALVEDGFEPNYDFLTIYNLNKDGVLVSSGRMKHGFNELRQSLESTVFLTFTSDRSTTGKGFLLEYIGFGPTINELGYTNLYSTAESGIEAFPKKRSISTGGYAFFSYIINPMSENPDGNGNDTRIFSFTVDSVDMASLHSGCENNYFSIHQLFANSFDLRLRNCEPNKVSSSTLTSSSPLLVTFYGYLNPRRTGFKVGWKTLNKSTKTEENVDRKIKIV